MTALVSFKDILAELALEEPEPTYEALLRWQKRFPDFRESLADFFALQATQREPIDDLPVIDEEEIAQKAVQYEMTLLEEQGRIIPDNHIEPVGDFDQMVLAAIYVLQGRADAGKLVEKISEMAGRPAYLGRVLHALSRLEGKHLIECWEAEAAPYRACASRSSEAGDFYYNITIAGERALAYAEETLRVVAGLLGDLA
jgi:hypothetical protein